MRRIQQPELHRVHVEHFGHLVHHLLPAPLELLLGVAPRRARAQRIGPVQISGLSPIGTGMQVDLRPASASCSCADCTLCSGLHPVLMWNSRVMAMILPSFIAPTLNLVRFCGFTRSTGNSWSFGKINRTGRPVTFARWPIHGLIRSIAPSAPPNDPPFHLSMMRTLLPALTICPWS